MKLEVGEFYLSASGEVFKIDSYQKGQYSFKTKNNYSYKQNGRYNDNKTELDLIAHIPKELHFRLCEIIEDYYIDIDVKEFVDNNYKMMKGLK